jgi:hypothetical protein
MLPQNPPSLSSVLCCNATCLERPALVAVVKMQLFPSLILVFMLLVFPQSTYHFAYYLIFTFLFSLGRQQLQGGDLSALLMTMLAHSQP